MTDKELKLECLRLAIDVKKAEADRSKEGIAELQHFFYNLVSSESVAEPTAEKHKRGRRSKEDELFS